MLRSSLNRFQEEAITEAIRDAMLEDLDNFFYEMDFEQLKNIYINFLGSGNYKEIEDQVIETVLGG